MASRRTHHFRALLAVPAFRRLLAVRLGGQFTDGVFQAALAGSVLFNPDRQATPTAIAFAAAVLVLPYSVVGPFAGVLLDRWSRRTVTVVTNLARAGVVLPIAALIFLGSEGPLFFVSTLVVIGLGRLLLSGLSAATPHVVPDERLVTANAVGGTGGSVAYSLGLGCALLLLQTVFPAGDTGYAAIALLAPVGYLTSAAMARFSFARDELGPDQVLPHRPGLAGEAAAVVRGMADGIRHLGQARGAAYAMGVQAGFRLLFGVLALAMLLLYRNRFAGDDLDGVPARLGLVFAAGAAGVLLAAAVTPVVARRVGGWRWVVGLLAAVAVALPVFGLPFDPLLLVVVVLVVNVAGHGIKIVVDTMVQHECADAFRGRVFAVNDTAFNLAYVLGMVAASRFIPDDGRSPVLLGVAAVGYGCLAVGYAVAAGRWARKAGDDIALPVGTMTAVDR
ncbi:MFS transporter [Micromonospora coxensis]|uniref:Major Facilitator Superfamily protein n=1 Tax=Micromonospora coxensis TaxID=356852 RepID=A0A1C5J3V5_9ACTN|nr:MFS transporter [Micromonospora coxensis]SCG64706.1 Major Facilitator Superfamily protein [Micromonospora coxensis]